MGRTANIVGWDNGGGLSRDIDILCGVLADLGWTVTVNGRRTGGAARARFARALGRVRRRVFKVAVASGVVSAPFGLNVHLEDINGDCLPLARRNVLIPNQEWFRSASFGNLSAIDEVWAKTRLAQGIFSQLGCKARLVGWMGADQRMCEANVPKTLTALHIAGSSLWKGTEAILDVWSEHPEWPLLRVVRRTRGYEGAELPWRSRPPASNIQIFTERLDEESLNQMQAESAIHLCPSEAEGFGHILLEGLSVGAIVITTDAPPMNEIVGHENGLLVCAERSEPMGLDRRYFVSRGELKKAVVRALSMSEANRDSMGRAARARFEQITRSFRESLRSCLESLN